MSHQNNQLATANCFLTFCSGNKSLLLFKFKSFVLNNSMFTFYIMFCISIVIQIAICVAIIRQKNRLIISGIPICQNQEFIMNSWQNVASVIGNNYYPDYYSRYIQPNSRTYSQRYRCYKYCPDYYPSYIYMIKGSQDSIVIASITVQTHMYLRMLAERCLLKNNAYIKSSCIGRPQVEKRKISLIMKSISVYTC